MQLRYEAKKTLYRIFLDRQHFLDRLPWLLQHVVLSKMPRHYLISLINAVDLTFVILEKIEELDRGLVVLRKQRKGGHSTTNRLDDEEGPAAGQGEDAEQRLQEQEEERDRQERLNDFAELQTQDFRLSDYVRKFQHNKVVEVCTVLLDECDTNTDELNRSIWRLFERIRTGAGDVNAALPGIFCQARVLLIFSRLLEQRHREGEHMRASLAELADFGSRIVEELMRLTENGAVWRGSGEGADALGTGTNAHIFGALLFWRSLRENQDFADLNLRLAYEEAHLHAGQDEVRISGPVFALADCWPCKVEPAAESDDGVALYDDADVLLDPELIAASTREDEARRQQLLLLKQPKRRPPLKPKSAYRWFFADERAKDKALTVKQFEPICRQRWEGVEAEVRAQYEAKARDDRERYAREMDAWVPSDDDDEGEDAEYRDEDARASKKRPALEPGTAEADAASSSSSSDVPIAQLKPANKKAAPERVALLEESSSLDVPIAQLASAGKKTVPTKGALQESPLDVPIAQLTPAGKKAAPDMVILVEESSSSDVPIAQLKSAGKKTTPKEGALQKSPLDVPIAQLTPAGKKTTPKRAAALPVQEESSSDVPIAQLRSGSKKATPKHVALEESSSSSDVPIAQLKPASKKATPKRALAFPPPPAEEVESSSDVPVAQLPVRRDKAPPLGVPEAPTTPQDAGSKRAKPDRAPDDAAAVGERVFSAAEDASLRRVYHELRERQPHELGRLLSVRVDWDGPVTHAQIARRLLALQLVDKTRFAQMNVVAK